MFEIPGVHHRAILFPAFPRDRPNNEEWLGNHELRRTSQKKRHQNLSGSSARCLSFSAGVKSLPGATIHLKSYSTSILDFCSSSKTQYRLHEVHEQRPRNSVAISVGMRGVACKMIRALRYRATTIDHDIPITSYVSLIRRVQRSTKALQPWEPVTVPVVFREPGLVPCLRSFFSFLSLFFAHFLFSFVFLQFFSSPLFWWRCLMITKPPRRARKRNTVETSCNSRARRFRLWSFEENVGRERERGGREREFRGIACEVVNRNCWNTIVFLYDGMLGIELLSDRQVRWFAVWNYEVQGWDV